MTGEELAKELGLYPVTLYTQKLSQAKVEQNHYYEADNIHKLLEGAVRVYGRKELPWPDGDGETLDWYTDKCQAGTDTHSALLIGVKKLKEETAEEIARLLLADLVNEVETLKAKMPGFSLDRARKFLERK